MLEARELAWTRWTDPIEGAFALDVPAGWQVWGGTRRPLPTDPRFVVQLRSPQGDMQIFIGDETIPTYVEPEGFVPPPEIRSMMTGNLLSTIAAGMSMMPPEGSLYAPGMVIMRFRDGEHYVKEYGQHFFGQLTGRPVTFEASRRDTASEAMFPRQGLLPGAEVSAGMATFGLSWPGGQGLGMISAVVVHMRSIGVPGGLWNVPLIHRLAVADRQLEVTAVSVWRRMLSTFVTSADWTKAQTNKASTVAAAGAASGTDAAAKALAEARQATIDAQKHVYDGWQAAYSAANAGWESYFRS